MCVCVCDIKLMYTHSSWDKMCLYVVINKKITFATENYSY